MLYWLCDLAKESKATMKIRHQIGVIATATLLFSQSIALAENAKGDVIIELDSYGDYQDYLEQNKAKPFGNFKPKPRSRHSIGLGSDGCWAGVSLQEASKP